MCLQITCPKGSIVTLVTFAEHYSTAHCRPGRPCCHHCRFFHCPPPLPPPLVIAVAVAVAVLVLLLHLLVVDVGVALTDVPANLDKLVHVHLHNVIPLVLFQMGAVIH